MSFCEERLRDVFGWRGCVIFLTNLLTRLRDFFCGEVARFFLMLRDFVVERLRDFFGGCMIFLVERLHVFFVWRGYIFLIGCMIFFLCGEVA